MTEYRYINHSMIRRDGEDKVTGRAEYGADIRRDDTLYMKGVYVPCVRGTIVEIQIDQAMEIPGVVKILTAKDLPGEGNFGIIVPDQPILTEKTIYSWGDVAAVVIAQSPEIAERAAEAVQVRCEELPPVTSVEETSEELRSEFYPGNITSSYHIRKGNVEEGLEQSSVVVHGMYDTQRIEHAYIEPESIFAEMEGETLVIRGSMQLPFDVQTCVSKALNLAMEQVSVRRSTIGGSFGGKIETTMAMASRAGMGAMFTGKPISYTLSREDSFRESYKRHGYTIDCTIGADEKGHLVAVKQHMILDGGAYMNLSPAIAWKSTVLGCGPYQIDHVLGESVSYMTNHVTCGSMRGFGTPQIIYAMENSMNELAYKLDLSPYQLRKQNLLREGQKTPGDDLIDEKISMEEVLDYVAREIDFDKKWMKYKKQGDVRYRYGVGIACTMRGTSGAQIKDKSQAVLYFDSKNQLHISLGLVEMGQGLNTAMIQIAAELFGINPEKIVYDEPDTSRELETGSTTGSRGTFMGGKALVFASQNLKREFYRIIQECDQKEIEEDSVVWKNGWIFSKTGKYEVEHILEIAKRNHRELRGVGVCDMEKPEWDFEKGSGKPFHVYTYSAQAAEVMVDTWTGRTRVLQVISCHDAGKIVNPVMAKGQVEGGILMSMGQALMENFKVDPETGIPLSKDFTNYMIPTITDMPKMQVHFIENEEKLGPFGAKSIAEPSVELGAASISGAVNMALGMENPIRKLPLTPETIVMHLRKRGQV